MNICGAFSFNEFVEKCLQYLSVFLHMHFLIVWFTTGWITIIYLAISFPSWRYFLLLYFALIYYDRKTPALGTRRSKWFRSWKLWKYHNDFFPAKLHKTAELPSDKNYLFCGFPHGVLCSGHFCTFGTEYGGFSEIFPGLTSYIVTLDQHFRLPIFREYCLFLGIIPASADCLNYFLGKKKNVVVVLMVGGAQEAFYSTPGVYKVHLKDRKGFLKIAYKNGVSLVPTISFGEPDLYHQIQFAEDSMFKKFQMLFKKLTRVAPIVFYGQFGLLPHKKNLNVVVGKPIPVEKVEKPTEDQLNRLQQTFIDALKNLFESEKHKYIENAENTDLIIS